MIMNRSHLCCSRSVRPTRTSTTPTWTTARTAPSTTRRPLSTRWNDVTNLLTTRTKSFCDPPAFTHRQNVLCYVGCHEYPLSGIEHSKHVINTWQLKCQIKTNKYVNKVSRFLDVNITSYECINYVKPAISMFFTISGE